MGGGGGKVKLPYLQMFKVKGRPFAYYRRDGKRQRVPGEIGSAQWLAAYQRIHASFEAPAPGQPPRGSIAAVVAEYLASPDFLQLAPTTKRDYRRYLDDIRQRCGDLLIAELPRSFVFQLRDRYAATPRKANAVVSVLRRLLSFAVDRGYRADNPALRPGRLREGPGHRSWREDEIETFRRSWAPETAERLTFELCLNTGQRIGDVIRLTRRDYAGGRITLRQGKTGELVDVPAIEPLRGILDAWLASHDDIVILTRNRRPLRRDTIVHVMRKAYEAAGLPTDCTTHGLRYSAATRLAEAGCDWSTIAAVTGHRTAGMVQKYTRRRRDANAALTRIEISGKRAD